MTGWIALLASFLLIPDAGFETDHPGGLPPRWQSVGIREGYWPRTTGELAYEGRRSLGLYYMRRSGPSPLGFGAVGSTLDAQPLRGRRLRFTAMARVPAFGRGRARLILCAGASLGDCAAARGGTPIHSLDWARHAVEAEVPADANFMVFGLRVEGAADAWIDNVAMEEVPPLDQ